MSSLYYVCKYLFSSKIGAEINLFHVAPDRVKARSLLRQGQILAHYGKIILARYGKITPI